MKEAKDEAVEAATARKSLAIMKEEWEAEKIGLQSDVLSLENEKSNLEANMEALSLELGEVQARCDKLNNEVQNSPFRCLQHVAELLQRISTNFCVVLFVVIAP